MDIKEPKLGQSKSGLINEVVRVVTFQGSSVSGLFGSSGDRNHLQYFYPQLGTIIRTQPFQFLRDVEWSDLSLH